MIDEIDIDFGSDNDGKTYQTAVGISSPKHDVVGTLLAPDEEDS
jgi:hypothetical protein